MTFSLATAVLVIGLLEGALALAAAVSPEIGYLLASPWEKSPLEPALGDPRLGQRPNPRFPGHDAKGFRNPRVPERAEIVALGDSQTYGTHVRAELIWPRQLETALGRSVYAMAYGGYGPGHSLLLWDEARALGPGTVIEAFYAGNDLYDAFNLVYNRGQLPALRSADETVAETVLALEKTRSLKRASQEETCRSGRPVKKANSVADEKSKRKRTFSARRLISNHSRLYGLVRRLRFEVGLAAGAGGDEEAAARKWREARGYAERRPEHCEVFEARGLRTLFTPGYRHVALDLEDPRVKEGVRIALEAIGAMNDKAKAQGIRFLVAMVPTKELVFEAVNREPSPRFRQLVVSERRFWELAADYFETHGIEYVALLPALQAELSAGRQPYHVTNDGHPNDMGHRAIAGRIAAYLEEGPG